jgi:signal transduction histidine kinase
MCFAALFALAADACVAGGGTPASELQPWRIAVVSSLDMLTPASLMLGPALNDALVGLAAPRQVQLYSEPLDQLRFPSGIEPLQIALLSKKYEAVPIDLVMAVGPAALDFVQRNRKTLWPRVPIVFAAVPRDAPNETPRPIDTTGVYFDVDIDNTLALVLSLQPTAKRLVVVGGNTPFDLEWNERLRRQDERLLHGIQMEFVNDRTLEEAAAYLEGLPPSSAVLFTSMSRDRLDSTYTARHAAGVLSRASRAPVYSIFATTLGSGVIGGSMTSLEDEAIAAAKLAVDVLRAGSANGIAAQASPPARCVLDYRVLERFDIADNAVPRGCDIRFRPPVIWRDYPLQFAVAIATIAILASLIAALLLQRKRRQEADVAIAKLRNTLFHASRLGVVGELTASIAHEINQPLGAILSNADAAEMMMERPTPDISMLRRILVDIRRDDLRASAVIRRIRGLVSSRETEPVRVNVNDLATEVLALLENEARRRDVTFDASLIDGLPPILGDRIQLQQVMLNLLVNAMDAMADTPEARRVVAITTAPIGDGRVELAVSDRGHGIASENMPRLFESFWSTKPQGMGLGLSIVKSIVEAHGGSIHAENNANGGATFRVLLPVAAESATMPS